MTRRLPRTHSKMELNLQLDQELEGTFPASDPLKITRFPTQTVELRGQAETRRPMAPRTMTRILRGTPNKAERLVMRSRQKAK